jgi:hypothetical protein
LRDIQRAVLLALALFFLAPPTAGADAELVGVASVIDGDTIEIHGRRVRLHGIDAPESAQTCLDGRGREWRCGQQAALVLQELLGRRTVACYQRDIDRYGRFVKWTWRSSPRTRLALSLPETGPHLWRQMADREADAAVGRALLVGAVKDLDVVERHLTELQDQVHRLVLVDLDP